jgi:hypothetical protein
MPMILLLMFIPFPLSFNRSAKAVFCQQAEKTAMKSA